MPVLDAEKTVLESITAMYDVCFQAEKKVADFILANPGLAVNANVSELANYSGVSDATVVRFCKHLGYEGYYQMRLLLARDIGRRTVFTDMVSQDETSVRGLFKSIADSAMAAAGATEEKVYLEAADIIRKCSMVHLVAAGNTTSLCKDLGPRLERTGIRCTYSTLAEHYMSHINLGSSSEVVLAISGTGTSKYVVKALELAKQKGMKSIAVTAYQYSPVSRIADLLLLSTPQGKRDNSMFRISRLSEMMVLEVLARILESTMENGNRTIMESEMFLSGTKF